MVKVVEVGPRLAVRPGDQRQCKGKCVQFTRDRGWRYSFSVKTANAKPTGPWFLGLAEPDKSVWDLATDWIGFRASTPDGRIEFVARHDGEEAVDQICGALRPEISRIFRFLWKHGGNCGPEVKAAVKDSDAEEKSFDLVLVDPKVTAHLPRGKELCSTLALSKKSSSGSKLKPQEAILSPR